MRTKGQERSPTILVVDDNADNRALAKATLEDEGYTVLLAASGEEGISACEREQPDCLLLDVRMPGMDGFTVSARVRSLPGGAEVPIVFLTALRDIETFDRALQAGCDDFLTKPVRPAELVVRIQSVLKLRRMGAELREQYDLVRRQRDALVRLQLQKERLTSFVVHDLKNPVHAMDLHAQLLLRDDEVPARAKASVQQIRNEARRLLRLVMNLLDISRSEEGELVPQLGQVGLDAFADELVEAFEVEAQTCGVRIEKAVEVQTVRADPDLLRRIIENLLDNALRHAPEGSVVKLSIRRRGRDVELRVSDEGSGVPDTIRDRVFDRFVRVSTGERSVSRMGRGLGLAFCKLATEAQGGTIVLEEGTPGAIFCVRLPHE